MIIYKSNMMIKNKILYLQMTINRIILNIIHIKMKIKYQNKIKMKKI